MRRAAAFLGVLALICAFVLGVEAVFIFSLKEAQAHEVRSRVFRIDFKGRRCEFCGCNEARFFEFSADSSGSASGQYFCRECREFCRYK